MVSVCGEDNNDIWDGWRKEFLEVDLRELKRGSCIPPPGWGGVRVSQAASANRVSVLSGRYSSDLIWYLELQNKFRKSIKIKEMSSESILNDSRRLLVPPRCIPDALAMFWSGSRAETCFYERNWSVYSNSSSISRMEMRYTNINGFSWKFIIFLYRTLTYCSALNFCLIENRSIQNFYKVLKTPFLASMLPYPSS